MTQINYIAFILSPKKSIPQLLEKEIKIILRETIHSYIEKKVDLKVVIKMASLIKQYGSDSLSTNMKNLIDEIQSMHVIDEALEDILDELSDK